MRLRHRTPVVGLSSAVLDPAYQSEVDEHTRRGEVAYARAAQRLARAEARREEARIAAACARASGRLARELRLAYEDAEREVEKRRAELRDVHRMMRAAPASQAHRGRGQFRPPVPLPGEPL